MKIRKLLFVISCMVSIISTTSCVDERYDLENVSGQVHLFENGVDLPLLKTGDLFFDDLISSDDQVTVNEEGIYEFGTNQSRVSVETEVVGKVRVPAQNLDFGTIKSFPAFIPSGIYTFDLPTEITTYDTNLDAQTAPLDSKITGIETVYTHEEWISIIKFSVQDDTGAPVSGASGISVEKIKFDNYKLELPEVLIIDKANVYASGNISIATVEESNTLILNGSADSYEAVVYVPLKGAIIGEESFIDHKIVLDQYVEMNGEIALTISNDGAATSLPMQIMPSIYIPAVYLDEAVGSADLSADMVPEKVYIGTLPDFLNSPETSLILTNPYLPLIVESSISIEAFSADVVLIPRDENDNYILDDNGNNIVIKIDNVSTQGEIDPVTGKMLSYNYVACQRVPALDERGYAFIECENLGMITKKIPSYIEVSAKGYSDPEKSFRFEMGTPFTATLDYEVRVPFMVEAGTCIIYEDITEDLNADIFETLMVKDIYVNAKILNGFPADMTLEVVPCDVEGNKLEGLEIIIPGSIKASESTELTQNVLPAETNLRLEIHELVDGEIQKIDQLKWRVKVSFPDKGLVSIYQALNMKIALELPEGFGINMDNLEN